MFRIVQLALLLAVCLPGSATAHAFGRVYNLPVPLWMYQYGAGAALIISFVIMAAFVGRQRLNWVDARWPLPDRILRLVSQPAWIALLRLASLATLLLAIASGLFGHPNPYVNFSMTAFWVMFLLGFFYLQALLGDLYAWLNPWRVLCDYLEHLTPWLFRARLREPERFGHLPALLLYLILIWLELYGSGSPLATGQMLLTYTLLTLAGASIWGIPAWFRYGECFAVLFRLVALMAPLLREQGRIYLRWPFSGLLKARCEGVPQLLIILFMLSSTAFDGLHVTMPWLLNAWELLRILLAEPLAADPAGAVQLLQSAMLGLQSASLLSSPFVYLLAYWVVVLLARRISGSADRLHDWLMCFGLSLVPIAFAYHFAHYYTLLQVQGIKILPLLSDPFGLGWNLLGTAQWFARPIVPDASFVWHLQVTLILTGHVVGVFIAHVAALQQTRGMDSVRAVILGQVPMLLLMVGLTASGLWILSQPIASS